MPRTVYLVGSALDRFREIPERSIHCIVTSPPYWGLRSYKGESGMIGLEPTWDEHLENIMAVFDEYKRVLRDDGTFWLNYGDAYATGQKGTRGDTKKQSTNKGSFIEGGIKLSPFVPAKNLLMMPARIALALQDRGWIIRSEIIWAKRNCMPESAKDRPTNAHEKLFLCTKQPRYFYDHVSVRTRLKNPDDTRPPKGSEWSWMLDKRSEKETTLERQHKRIKNKPSSWANNPNYQNQDPRYKKRDQNPENRKRFPTDEVSGIRDRSGDDYNTGTANLRNVWHLTTESFKGAHFATFPTKLVEPCIKAGTSEKGVCSKCGSPWVRQFDTEYQETGNGIASQEMLGQRKEVRTWEKGMVRIDHTTGWKSTCDCKDAYIIPATVLDPFAGAGTTGMVANYLQRDAILVEISPEYAKLGADRIRKDGGMLVEVEIR